MLRIFVTSQSQAGVVCHISRPTTKLKMTAEEIREISINSSTAYYDYLELNKKGIQEVNILELEKVQGKDLIIKLRLSAKLFDTEAIFFRNLKNNKEYDTSEAKIIEYDRDKNILLIKPIEGIISDFDNLTHNDLKVISDLKFLVQRVKAWYETNGSKISLPSKVSKYSNDVQNIEFFKEPNFQPSENQKKSLVNIFTNPFSYVWGAPGTGKTQFVLAYAILHYIRKGDKIAILAPTNNAIEQVLRGVLKMTDKAGVDRKQIIRLGTPTKKFAEEYPEVCEEKGIQKKLQEFDKQIAILERMINFQSQKQRIILLENSILDFESIKKLLKSIDTKNTSINEINSQFKKKEIEIKLFDEKFSNQNTQLLKGINQTKSITHKIVKVFSNKQTKTEINISDIENKIFETKKSLEYSKYELTEIQENLTKSKSKINEIQNKTKGEIDNLINKLSEISEVKEVISKLTFANISNIKDEVISIIDIFKSKMEVDEHLFTEYSSSNFIDLKSELADYISLRNSIAISSTEERLKSVNVIACTLDGYIGRYTETKLNVEHIFLDEAGYANIIKALTLFNHSTPISFLGDHMQLPPVCEINDADIERDFTFSNMFLWAQSAIFLDTLFPNSKEICKNQYLKNINFNPISIIKTELNSTYRFGSNLAKILGEYVYTSDFNSSNPEGETKIIFIDAKKIEGPLSRISINEVNEIKKLVSILKQNSKDDFVILTPYSKQLKLLNSHLPQERNDFKILTVHGSQGREWETVILSVVDTSDKWFVDTTKPISKGLNLVNTAVSRAKKNLIIICDKTYWTGQQGQLITELLKCGNEMKN